MIENDLLAKLAGFGFFYRWHPAIALRYLPIVDKINEIKGVNNILEVGSGGLGIAPYLKRKVTGVDTNFQPPFHPLLERIKASAIKLPFGDSSFDIVISVDMLEHLEIKDRTSSIGEMMRVAKKRIFIAFPTGEEAEREDETLSRYYEKKFGRQYRFFEEQINEGLPKKDVIAQDLNASSKYYKKKIKYNIAGNENIHIHNFLMKGWMTKNIFADIFFRKLLLFAVPIVRYLDKAPYYRQIFSIEII